MSTNHSSYCQKDFFSGQIPMVLHLVMSTTRVASSGSGLLAFIIFKQLFHLDIILSSILRINYIFNIHSFVIIVII